MLVVWDALRAALVSTLLVRLSLSVLYQIEGKKEKHLFLLKLFVFSWVLSIAAGTGAFICWPSYRRGTPAVKSGLRYSGS